MKHIILLPILFLGCLLINAQNKEDTITKWKAKFATLAGIPKLSSNGNWISISKHNNLQGDSTFVISTREGSKTVYRIINSELFFLEEEGVLGHNGSTAEYLNLITGKTYKYDSILKVYPLQKYRYALLSKNQYLRLFDKTGKVLHEVSGVDDLAINDSKNTLYFKKQNAGKWEIIGVSGDFEKTIYSTTNRIEKLDFVTAGKYLFLIEARPNAENDVLVVLDLESPNKKMLEVNVPKHAMVNFSEIQDSKTFLISAKQRFIEEKDPIVETWYGNDPYLNVSYKRFSAKKFWTWDAKSGNLQKMDIPEHNEVSSLNNKRYFVTYTPRKGHNFASSEPELNGAQIYDLKLNTLTDIGDLKWMNILKKGWKPESLNEIIFCSPDGKKFLATSDHIRWTLFNSNGLKETTIDQQGLEQPIFSKNGEYIFFESSNGLWRYNIAQSKLISFEIARDKVTRIKNGITKRDEYSTVSYLPTEKLLVESYDKDENTLSYSLLSGKKWKLVIPSTKNRIKPHQLLFSPSLTSFYTVEENFNLPPSLYAYTIEGKKRLLFDAGIKDEQAKKIKQEIYSYSAIGKNLKGVLYYPQNYDPQKKYPMVVHIYEMQRTLANAYLSPNFLLPVGFKIRTMLEIGYFVYLPDIVFGQTGSGLSALECVNKALDAVLKNPNIESNKIGLAGQSLGGYETNFIATHSTRFATYISGAGSSDMIRNYYSFNYNFMKPYYFAFDKIYQMGTTVAEDKERYIQNSPILNVEKVNAPILLWAGKKDENVPWDLVVEFYIGLRRYKKDVIALLYPKGNHSFPIGTSEEKDLSKKVLDWWDYFLKDKQDIQWINIQMKKDAQ